MNKLNYYIWYETKLRGSTSTLLVFVRYWITPWIGLTKQIIHGKTYTFWRQDMANGIILEAGSQGKLGDFFLKNLLSPRKIMIMNINKCSSKCQIASETSYWWVIFASCLYSQIKFCKNPSGLWFQKYKYSIHNVFEIIEILLRTMLVNYQWWSKYLIFGVVYLFIMHVVLCIIFLFCHIFLIRFPCYLEMFSLVLSISW